METEKELINDPILSDKREIFSIQQYTVYLTYYSTEDGAGNKLSLVDRTITFQSNRVPLEEVYTEKGRPVFYPYCESDVIRNLELFSMGKDFVHRREKTCKCANCVGEPFK